MSQGSVYLGDGDDIAHGGGAGEVFFGGEGNDTLDGGPGPDWLFGEGGTTLRYSSPQMERS